MNGNEITRGKPNPEVFLKAAHELKLPPERCVFVDSLRERLRYSKTLSAHFLEATIKPILTKVKAG